MVRISTIGIMGVLMTAAVVAAQQPDEAQIRARQRISMMEGTLERAVTNGADNLLRRMRAVTPETPMLGGVPQVRGFRLDGYGVFFDVGVPLLRLPVTWPLRYMTRDTRDLGVLATEFKTLMTRSRMDAQSQEQFARLLRRLEVQAQGPVALPGTGAQAQAPSQTVPPAVDPSLIDDPAEGYTREVKAALIDAMIENSGPLGVAADEWLTVAARDNVPRDPLVPGDTADFSTVILRLRGSDLAAFREGRVNLEETRKKVEVREY